MMSFTNNNATLRAAALLRYEPTDTAGPYARFVPTEPAPQWPVSPYSVPVMGTPDVPCVCAVCAGTRGALLRLCVLSRD
jgi:hypothetical protein